MEGTIITILLVIGIMAGLLIAILIYERIKYKKDLELKESEYDFEAAEEAALRSDLAKGMEELEKEIGKFHETMESLGIVGDPLNVILDLTKARKLEWQPSNKETGERFEADFVDGIKIFVGICDTKRSGSTKWAINYSIHFEDTKNRFEWYAGWLNYFEHEDSELRTREVYKWFNDPRPKELIEILEKNCKPH